MGEFIDIDKSKIHQDKPSLRIEDFKKAEGMMSEWIRNHGKDSYTAMSTDVKETSVWKMAVYIVINAPKLLVLLFKLIHYLKGFEMNKDKQTTIIGLVKVLFGLVTIILGYFKINVPDGLLGATIDTVVFFTTGAGYLLFSFIQAFFTNKKDE